MKKVSLAVVFIMCLFALDFPSPPSTFASDAHSEDGEKKTFR